MLPAVFCLLTAAHGLVIAPPRYGLPSRNYRRPGVSTPSVFTRKLARNGCVGWKEYFFNVGADAGLPLKAHGDAREAPDASISATNDQDVAFARVFGSAALVCRPQQPTHGCSDMLLIFNEQVQNKFEMPENAPERRISTWLAPMAMGEHAPTAHWSYFYDRAAPKAHFHTLWILAQVITNAAAALLSLAMITSAISARRWG